MKIKYIVAICIVSIISLGISSVTAEASCGGKKHPVSSDHSPTETNSLTMPITNADNGFSSEFINAEMQRVKTNPDNTVSINVSVPIQEVFDFLLTRVDAYSPDTRSVSFDHSNSQKPQALDEGSERITVMKNAKSLVQRLINIDAPTSFTYFTDMQKTQLEVPITYSIAHYEFTEQEDGSVTATISVVYQPKSRMTAPFVRRSFNKAMNRDFKNAERILETQ